MADDSYASTSAGHATGRTTSFAPASTGSSPPGYGLRRAVTVDESLRRRPTLNTSPSDLNNFSQDARRRSSNFSDYSFTEARRSFEAGADEVWNLGVNKSQPRDKSPYVFIPLLAALLPAVGGMLFENGSTFFTDVILLALAAIFLHWSVTQPWQWYHEAQAIRVVKDEIMDGSVFDSDSDLDQPSPSVSATTALENVPEENEKDVKYEEGLQTPVKQPSSLATSSWEARREAAVKELYFHEMLALMWCFVFPLIGAYLLHTIRGQLSRPSEGLVSNYNLSIFIMAAEVRPVSHLIKLISNRTLRVQRIVANNPHQVQSIKNQEFRDLSKRLEELESRATAAEASTPTNAQIDVSNTRHIETIMARNVRDKVEPELDALNRAVRRYEKKLALLAGQMDTRLEYLDGRLNDAIAVAAMAAKQSNAQGSLGGWLVERTLTFVMLPVQTAVAVLTFPFRTVSSLLGRKSRTPEKHHKRDRNGRVSGSGRASADRVPARMSRR
jgi:hypothetical protein